ncbi:MAG: diadenylate cyclase [Candidatus Omnitrophica bacterium]|nr:diadenylate cyclase [Candidatus Omnitrophota bacterium]
MNSDIYLAILVVFSIAILIFRGLRFFSWNRFSMILVLASCMIAIMGYFYSERFAELLRMASGTYLFTIIIFVFADFIVDWISAFRNRARPDKTVLKKAPYLLEISRAFFVMAKQRTGALIVITCKDNLRPHVDGGMEWDAEVRAELLMALFAKSSPLHDGALIIRDGRVKRVKAIINFTSGFKVPFGIGTRHRSAIGITHKTDAVALVVSEERGEVSIASRGALVKVPNEQEFLNLAMRALKGKKLA